MKKLGVYIHIPFCKQKCLYCDFISFPQKEEMQEQYIKSLIKEINWWKEQNRDIEIETIYIGGGTPSYIESKYIAEILENIVKKEQEQNYSTIKKAPALNCQIDQWQKRPGTRLPEMTLEVNPGTITEQKLQKYRDAGIDRLSIGLQSTNDKLLKQIGRIHTYEEFLNTYKLARKAGFENINVDLMIGLPNQTIQDVKSSLDELLNLKPSPPEHISVYSLIVEENTPIQNLIEIGDLTLPDEELERNMYWYVKNYLELNRIQTL